MIRIVFALVFSLLLQAQSVQAFTGYLIFNVIGDPLDPETSGLTGTGWTEYHLRNEGIDPNKPSYYDESYDIPLSFTWEGITWDESNAFLSETDGNSYYDFTGIVNGWAAQSGTTLDWLDSPESPFAFSLSGKGDFLTFDYYDERGLHHGSGTWFQSQDGTLPVSSPPLADVPEPAGLVIVGLMGLSVWNRGPRTA